MQNIIKRLSVWAGAILVLLLIPLALTIRDGNVKDVGWNWSPFDFIFMFVLLFGAGTAYELISRKMPTGIYRAGVGLSIITSVLLVWVNGAVGIIGDSDLVGPNGVYILVLVMGFIGAMIARFRPRGMAYILFITAFAIALIPLFASILWKDMINLPPGIWGVIGINSFFVLMYIVSGLLFQQAIISSTK